MNPPRMLCNCHMSIRAMLALLLLVGIVSVPGCGESGDPTPEQAMERLERDIRRALPRGWQVGSVAQAREAAGLELEGEGLVVWRPEKVELRQRDSEGQPVEAVLYFYLQRRPWIDPADYSRIREENDVIRRQHEDVLASIANIPRNAEGELMPRDQYESAEVADFRRAYEQLPEYDRNLPTHHYRGISLSMHDPRTQLVPAQREQQTETNVAFGSVNNLLTSYRR